MTGSGLTIRATAREVSLITRCSMITTGISRGVRCWYSSYGGQIATIFFHRAGFSAGEAVRARALKRSAITCT